jgi:hypothetical protein
MYPATASKSHRNQTQDIRASSLGEFATAMPLPILPQRPSTVWASTSSILVSISRHVAYNGVSVACMLLSVPWILILKPSSRVPFVSSTSSRSFSVRVEESRYSLGAQLRFFSLCFDLFKGVRVRRSTNARTSSNCFWRSLLILTERSHSRAPSLKAGPHCGLHFFSNGCHFFLASSHSGCNMFLANFYRDFQALLDDVFPCWPSCSLVWLLRFLCWPLSPVGWPVCAFPALFVWPMYVFSSALVLVALRSITVSIPAKIFSRISAPAMIIRHFGSNTAMHNSTNPKT